MIGFESAGNYIELSQAFFEKKLWNQKIQASKLCYVKTDDLGVFEAFSVGDITVRKANDPSYIV